MELVRKIGLWIVAAIVMIAAGAVYFTAVRKTGAEVGKEIETLEARKEKLAAWARKKNDIPNPKWIDEAKVWAKRVNDELDECALFIAVQPLDSYRRSFYRDERVGVDNLLFNEISRDLGKYEWTQAYAEHCAILQNKIDRRPGAAFPLRTQAWPTLLPTDEEITQAMQLFWVQKEVADRISDLVERDLNEMLAPNQEAGVFPAKAADLVITRGETELSEPLRLLDPSKLVQVAEAILLNDEKIDLATIFDTYLKNPEDAQANFSWDRVYSLTSSEEQQRFLDGLVRDPKDYFNRQRFVDYVMELRSVRYRTDVAALLEREGSEFATVGAQLRNMTENDRIVLKARMRRWNRTRLAQTIAAIVAIRDEDDYKTVRDNHDPKLAGVLTLDITAPAGSTALPEGGGGLAGGIGRRAARGAAPETPKSENYESWPVTLSVRIEFQRIPILMRRLLTSSMRFRFSIQSIMPETQPGSRTGIGSRTGPAGPRVGRAPNRLGGGIPRVGLPRAPYPGEEETPGEERLEVLRNYVTLVLQGEGYQFTPLREKFKDRLEDKASETLSPKPASETDARRPETAEGPR